MLFRSSHPLCDVTTSPGGRHATPRHQAWILHHPLCVCWNAVRHRSFAWDFFGDRMVGPHMCLPNDPVSDECVQDMQSHSLLNHIREEVPVASWSGFNLTMRFQNAEGNSLHTSLLKKSHVPLSFSQEKISSFSLGCLISSCFRRFPWVHARRGFSIPISLIFV